jgi:Undecaprenyl-phosphate glucose phosphotransferase
MAGPTAASDDAGTAPKSGAAQERVALAEALLSLQPTRSASAVVISGLWRLAEVLLAAFAGAVVYWAYIHPQLGWQPAYALVIPTGSILAVMALEALGLYDLAALRRPLAQAPRLLAGWTLAFLIAFAIGFFLKLEGVFSRVFAASWHITGLMLLIGARAALAWRLEQLTRAGRLDRRTAIVGGGAEAAALLQALRQEPGSDIRVIGLFDDRWDERSPDVVSGVAKLGNVDDMVGYSRHARLDLVLFSLPVVAEARILTMLKKLSVLPVDIRLAAHTQRLRFRPRNYSYVAGLPVFDMADKPIADWDFVQKWLFDKLVGGLLLILLSPVMLAVALAVKLTSRGPVLFRQKRYGFNNELIEVYKFRSMYTDRSDAAADRLVTRDDPRVTPVGRFIRRASLDELPQLFNVVFKGNLSIVGPRPHALHAKAENRLYDQVVDGYFARHRVKPGITGWAQVNGWRGETDTEEKIQQRVAFDLAYIENWSLWFDLLIVLRTPLTLLKAENAY